MLFREFGSRGLVNVVNCSLEILYLGSQAVNCDSRNKHEISLIFITKFVR